MDITDVLSVIAAFSLLGYMGYRSWLKPDEEIDRLRWARKPLIGSEEPTASDLRFYLWAERILSIVGVIVITVIIISVLF
jgi:hypothetical protein